MTARVSGSYAAAGCMAAILAFSIPARSFEVETHERINSAALPHSQANLYLQDNLGLPEGLLTIVEGQALRDWIPLGGRVEDDEYRPLRHFHTPLRDWSGAGLFGLYDSSVRWAQRRDQGASWQNARDAFYDALTLGPKAERDARLADAFRMLGQVMHNNRNDFVQAFVQYEVYNCPIINNDSCSKWDMAFDYEVSNSTLAMGISSRVMGEMWTGNGIRENRTQIGDGGGTWSWERKTVFSGDWLDALYLGDDIWDEHDFDLTLCNPTIVRHTPWECRDVGTSLVCKPADEW